MRNEEGTGAGNEKGEKGSCVKLDGHVTFTNAFTAVSGLAHFLQNT